ncbi:hypothetical protein CK203_060858 [Vitis vinifera]|uniref:Retrotransposon gag domain-containing protein n=1 Tax=Vitis vinifera TaxID=29760 RepID=A0A438FUA5_VITVI|nr:hypothetical protein CK203_060858 [Vitis vinifera]
MPYWIRDQEGRLVRIENPQDTELDICVNIMDPPQEDQNSQQGQGGNPNAYLSMRDRMHPPRMSAPSCIVPPFEQLIIRPHIVPLLPNFHGMESENPYAHIKEFEEVCNTFREGGASIDLMRLKLFPFTLKDKAKIWLNSLRPRSMITTKTYESIQACQMMEELLGQVKARILDIYKLEFQVETRAQAKRSKEEKQANSGSQESNASNHARFGAEMRKIWPSEANCSSFSKYGCYVMAWMQSHGNFSCPEVISYELLEGEVFNSKFCINPLEPISMAIERTNGLKRQISNFSAKENEKFYECWERYMEAINACPHHGFDTWLLVSYFYDGMSSSMKQILETMCGGDFMTVREMLGDQANVVGQFRPNNSAPYGNTYNSSWRNHPNFSWKPRPPPYQPQAKPKHLNKPLQWSKPL